MAPEICASSTTWLQGPPTVGGHAPVVGPPIVSRRIWEIAAMWIMWLMLRSPAGESRCRERSPDEDLVLRAFGLVGVADPRAGEARHEQATQAGTVVRDDELAHLRVGHAVRHGGSSVAPPPPDEVEVG